MEKERSDRAVERDQEKERMQNEIKSLSLRVNQLQRSLEKQQSKPSTSSRPADKSTMEPPTANIKPMAGASSTAGKQKQTTVRFFCFFTTINFFFQTISIFRVLWVRVGDLPGTKLHSLRSDRRFPFKRGHWQCCQLLKRAQVKLRPAKALPS